MKESKLTYRQMQEMLPDYLFGRLGVDERRDFEECIEFFPDIQGELDDAKAVFGKLEELDYKSIIDKKTRNLSVQVQSRLHSGERKSLFSGNSLIKLVIPTLALVVLIFIIIDPAGTFFAGKNDKTTANKIDSSADDNFILSKKDAMTLVDSTVGSGALLAASASVGSGLDHISSLKETAKIDDELNNFVKNELSKSLLDALGPESAQGLQAMPYRIMDEDLYNLSEDDLQVLMEALENEDFNS